MKEDFRQINEENLIQINEKIDSTNENTKEEFREIHEIILDWSLFPLHCNGTYRDGILIMVLGKRSTRFSIKVANLAAEDLSLIHI